MTTTDHRYVGEALPTATRWRLVRIYHAAGMTDEDIAARMTQTVYTTARIRSSMGLAPNPREGVRHA